MSNLELIKVSESYGENQVLVDINLSLKKGEFATIIGPNGCGKSTLLKLAAKILSPIEGQIKRPINTAYLPQQLSLLPWKTVEQNILLPLQLNDKIATSKESNKVLKEFGLSKFANKYPSQLSGGMQQKLAILRSMMISPQILLLDEPFSSLDAITRAQMQDWLLEIWAKNKPSVLMVTHDIREAILMSDTIFVLSDRPGTIKKVFEVNIERPRKYSDLNSKFAVGLENELRKLLV